MTAPSNGARPVNMNSSSQIITCSVINSMHSSTSLVTDSNGGLISAVVDSCNTNADREHYKIHIHCKHLSVRRRTRHSHVQPNMNWSCTAAAVSPMLIPYLVQCSLGASFLSMPDTVRCNRNLPDVPPTPYFPTISRFCAFF